MHSGRPIDCGAGPPAQDTDSCDCFGASFSKLCSSCTVSYYFMGLDKNRNAAIQTHKSFRGAEKGPAEHMLASAWLVTESAVQRSGAVLVPLVKILECALGARVAPSARCDVARVCKRRLTIPAFLSQ